ncbi:zinc uptake protein ZrgA [Sulfitobacter donghicola]|uniref:Zinc-binding protein n=1 Tax=Sulfitobacter donghicola DSW-25 = KCTC 12864 = JCM 14565 TaxID=1300350 RepID=A0A073IXG8_9RHOB|nr:DUF2796 domain-containing protein [Sulfitobacter donghicola]KEJ90062.1 hypothetical protein DSW25_07595 [Sulfitobacter donghicola DSW-25 = KCTC 12864 = JCM 14565]KIN66794.1 DUF2796 domain containing protein [Sulfitobacter donghicola DSW-25 = KCTC 12864 = JCM 14565]
MKFAPFFVFAAFVATPVLGQETRQLDAHEHGVGKLNIAFDGDQIALELHAPGADIVGFEYQATSDEDHAAIERALATLAKPLDLFAFPAKAGCNAVKIAAELESEEDSHADHSGHNDSDHSGHNHSYDHGKKHKKKQDDHADHADHTEQADHTEFHAQYLLGCSTPQAATKIAFPYFEAFPNALEVEVQVITDKGATAFEVGRDEPLLDLSALF